MWGKGRECGGRWVGTRQLEGRGALWTGWGQDPTRTESFYSDEVTDEG